jgi:hypothetical protein
MIGNVIPSGTGAVEVVLKHGNREDNKGSVWK